MPLVAQPGTGYNDYQTFGNYDSSILWQTASATGNTPVTSPVMNMTKYAAVGGYFLCTLGQCICNFVWYSDALLTFTIASRTVVLTSNITIGFGGWLIPNMGPFLQVQFTNIAGGNFQMNALAFGTNRTAPIQVSPQNGVLISQQGVSLGANSTLALYPTDYYSGPVQIWYDPQWAVGLLLFEVLSSVGNWDDLQQVQQSAAGNVSESIVVPLGAWRVVVGNSTGSAGTFFLTVTPSTTGAT